MTTTMWILSIFFGGFAGWTAVRYMLDGVSKFELVMAFIAAIIAAYSIGMLIDPTSFHVVIER